jgi:hypothetical protein
LFIYLILVGEGFVRACTFVVHLALAKSSRSVSWLDLKVGPGEQPKYREKLDTLYLAIPLPQILAGALFLAWSHLTVYN